MWIQQKSRSTIKVIGLLLGLFGQLHSSETVADVLSKFKIIRMDYALGSTAAAVAFGSKVVYDMSWHKQYACQSKNYYASLQQCLTDQEFIAEELYDLCTFDTCYNVVQLVKNIRNSYSSYVTPWNWKQSQKEAFNISRITLLCMLCVYLEGLSESKERVRTVSALFNNKTYTSLIDFVDILKPTCGFIQRLGSNTLDHNVIALAHSFVPAMQALLHEVMISDEYLDQVRYRQIVASCQGMRVDTRSE
ncbi:hypothetical protein KBD08_03125 [Candidatus Babeliales bacterium]|nr:hypothetical protein [Candidatus Babeliales bacterium]